VEDARRKGQTPNRATRPTVQLLVGYRLPAGWHTRGDLARAFRRIDERLPTAPQMSRNVNGIAA